MISIAWPANPRLVRDFFAQNRDVARGMYADSDLRAPNFQNRYGDVISDCHGLSRSSGQNEHNPLSPDVICIHCVRINIIVSGHYSVQGLNLAACAQELSFEASVKKFGNAVSSGI
jgi:hypothetical protein